MACLHVSNRALASLTLFEEAEDDHPFERVLTEAVASVADFAVHGDATRAHLPGLVDND